MSHLYYHDTTFMKKAKKNRRIKMNKQKPRDTPEIVVPKGYDLLDLIDTDDGGYGFEDEAIYTEEVKVKIE